MAFLLLAGTAGVRAQQCDVPQIGAQVFVEPGQTPEDIDGFFRLLHDNGMKVARIRMFGCLLYTSPSPRDRSLSRMPSSA